MAGAQDRISVLFLIDKLGLGGAQVHVCRLIRGLDPAKFEPSLCCLQDAGPMGEELRPFCREVFSLGCRRLYLPGGLWRLRRLARWVREHRPDIVNSYLFSANTFGVLAASRGGARGIVASRRDTGFWRRPWHTWLKRFANRRVAAITVNSRAVAQAVAASEGLPADRLRLIPNGVDTARFRPAPSKAEGGPPVVGVVAGFRDVKNHEVLVAAAPRVLERFPAARFVLVGAGPRLGAIEELVRQAGLGASFEFRGESDRPETLLPGFDIVLPSLSEGCSNALLEAMACGLPAAASRTGGNVDAVVEGETGFLFDPYDPRELAARLVELLANADLRKRLGAAARQRVEREFSLEAMIRQYAGLFREVAGRLPSRPS